MPDALLLHPIVHSTAQVSWVLGQAVFVTEIVEQGGRIFPIDNED